MTTLQDLLKDADPLGREAQWTDDQRGAIREAALAALSPAARSPRPGMAMVAIAALALVASVTIGSRVWSHATVDVEAAAIRFDVRLAEERPAEGLRAAAVTASGATIYIPQDVVVSNGDIVEAHAVPGHASTFSVAVTFSAEGAAKLRDATRRHMGRPLAIVVDGKVVVAPVVRATVSTSAVIDGDFSEAEAEAIAAGILGR